MNTLRGYVTLRLTLDDGRQIRFKFCPYNESGRSRWIWFPAIQYTTNGMDKHANAIEFVDIDTKDEFMAEAIAALDTYLAAQTETQEVA